MFSLVKSAFTGTDDEPDAVAIIAEQIAAVDGRMRDLASKAQALGTQATDLQAEREQLLDRVAAADDPEADRTLDEVCGALMTVAGELAKLQSLNARQERKRATLEEELTAAKRAAAEAQLATDQRALDAAAADADAEMGRAVVAIHRLLAQDQKVSVARRTLGLREPAAMASRLPYALSKHLCTTEILCALGHGTRFECTITAARTNGGYEFRHIVTRDVVRPQPAGDPNAE